MLCICQRWVDRLADKEDEQPLPILSAYRVALCQACGNLSFRLAISKRTKRSTDKSELFGTLPGQASCLTPKFRTTWRVSGVPKVHFCLSNASGNLLCCPSIMQMIGWSFNHTAVRMFSERMVEQPRSSSWFITGQNALIHGSGR